MEVLKNLVQKMSKTVEINEMLNILSETVKHQLGADRSSVFLLDREKNELWTIIASGLENDEIRMPANLGLAGQVVLSGKIINVINAYKDPRFDKEVDNRTGYKTNSILSVPLNDRLGNIIGVFQALNKYDGAFNEEDITFLQILAFIASSSIENFQFYEDSKNNLEISLNSLATTYDDQNRDTPGFTRRICLYSEQISKEFEKDKLRYLSLLINHNYIGDNEKMLCSSPVQVSYNLIISFYW